MADILKSNIRIKSNIFLLSDGDHPERDADFAAQVLSAAPLAELKRRADANGVEIAFSEVQQRILNGETNIRLSEIKPAQPDAADKPQIQEEQTPELENAVSEEAPEGSAKQAAESIDNIESLEFNELLKRGFGGEKTLIICANDGWARYVSLLLDRGGFPNIMTGGPAAPVRHFADVLWDSNDRVLSRDNFNKRFTARCAAEAARADECFDALCGFAGNAPSEGLDTGALAAKIMSGGVPDSLFGGRNIDLTVAAAEKADPEKFGKVYVLENGFDELPSAAKESARIRMADCPEVISAENSAVIVGNDGKVSVSIGGDDVDVLSFIGGTVGVAVGKQAYISRNVKCGDPVTLELNGGVYDVVHSGQVIAKTTAAFSDRVLGEFGGKRYFEELPQSLGGVRITNIMTVVSCRGAEEFGESVPPLFRGRSFWLGVELGGFAK